MCSAAPPVLAESCAAFAPAAPLTSAGSGVSSRWNPADAAGTARPASAQAASPSRSRSNGRGRPVGTGLVIDGRGPELRSVCCLECNGPHSWGIGAGPGSRRCCDPFPPLRPHCGGASRMHRTIGKQRLAPHEAEALWRAWSTEKDKRARDRLVLSYSPMVRYLAVRKARELPAHCELDDLVSHGLLALIEAVDRFDPRKGASFEQYAWTRVAGAIMDELRRQDWAPRSVRRTARAIERKRDAFYAREGTLPSDEELARESSL